MKLEKIKDYNDLKKVNESYIINTNNQEYEKALQRRKFLAETKSTALKVDETINRLDLLEEKIDSILSFIKDYYGNNSSSKD